MLTLFYLKNCPFCKRALQYIEELKAEHEELQRVEIEMIEESEQPEVADRYDYYYVPCFYLGEEKLHEGGIYKEEVEALALPYVPQQVRWDGTQGENAAMEWLRCDMIDADKVVFEPFIESMSRNMPYLCRPQSPRSGRLYFCASDVNIAADVAADVPTQTGFYANATRAEITGDEQVYLLADDGMTFVRAAQGSWIAPRRAYVVLSDMSMVNLRIHIMEQTSMHHPTTVGQETYYDLSGVYVGKKKKDAPFPADWKKGVLISSDGKVVMNAVK